MLATIHLRIQWCIGWHPLSVLGGEVEIIAGFKEKPSVLQVENSTVKVGGQAQRSSVIHLTHSGASGLGRGGV